MKKPTHKWLTLLFIASFLLNIQASYACAMMPDMAQQPNECCCGSNHRMDDSVDISVAQTHSIEADIDISDTEPDCIDPQLRCCIVAMSVGINDPPGDESTNIANSTKIVPHKLIKQMDSEASPFVWYAWPGNINWPHSNIYQIPPDPLLQRSTTPQYQATQRYRL